VVCGGDITWFGKDLDKILKKISTIDKMVLMIQGNHEEGDSLGKKCKKYNNIRFIHQKSFRMGNKVFFGYGKGSFAREDKRFERCFNEFKKTLKKDDEVILVTHGNPYKTKFDLLYDDAHVGNKSFNKAIKVLKPVLYICGHLHENTYVKDVIGSTLVINPGPDGTMLKV